MAGRRRSSALAGAATELPAREEVGQPNDGSEWIPQAHIVTAPVRNPNQKIHNPKRMISAARGELWYHQLLKMGGEPTRRSLNMGRKLETGTCVGTCCTPQMTAMEFFQGIVGYFGAKWPRFGFVAFQAGSV